MVYYLTRLASWLAGHCRARCAWPSLVPSPADLLCWVAKRRNTIANMAQVLGTTPNDPRAQAAGAAILAQLRTLYLRLLLLTQRDI